MEEEEKKRNLLCVREMGLFNQLLHLGESFSPLSC